MNSPAPPDFDLAQGVFRATFSLPRQLARDIADVAKGLGVSQSALMTELLQEPVRNLAKVVALTKQRDAAGDYATAKRYHGQSVDLVREAVRAALAAVDGVNQQLPL